MKSSSGAHFIALDHVRAFAALMVFTWHFTHAGVGYPVPFEYVPNLFPFAILDEGHTGVALFMALSGYLFAKLLDGKRISYYTFLWNRALRLLPLLLIVILFVAFQKQLQGENMVNFFRQIAKGVLLPTLPNGGWSITVEFHYYLILPIIFWMLRKSKYLPLALIAAARIGCYFVRGEVQMFAYWTILGRIDQFALGMIFFQFRNFFSGRHIIAFLTMIGFCAFYWYFDLIGGFYKNVQYPSPSLLWLIMPTIEGLAYATLIAWYESSFKHSVNGISWMWAKMGEYSYSIYLLHFFVVFHAAKFIHEHVMPIANFYLACIWAFITFVMMAPIGYLSFRFVEAPFLRLRKQYILPN